MLRSPLIPAVSSSVIYLLLLAVSGQTPPAAPLHSPGGYLPNHNQHAQENTGTPSVGLGSDRKPGGGHHRPAQPPPSPPQGVALLHQEYAISNNTNSTANVPPQPQGVGGQPHEHANNTNRIANVPPQPQGVGEQHQENPNSNNTNPIPNGPPPHQGVGEQPKQNSNSKNTNPIPSGPPPHQGVGEQPKQNPNSNNTNPIPNVPPPPQGVGEQPQENPNSNNNTNPKPDVPPPGMGGGNPKMDNYANHTNPAMLFGWNPEKAKENYGLDCDLDKYLLRQEFLTAHNWIRLLFNQPLFTWDEKLESAARKYAMERYDDCKMIHSDMPYGENLFWGLKLHWTASDAVFLWFREGQWYDRMSLKCTAPSGHGCGHFTQLVWKDSVRLGCALQHCRDRSKGLLIICEYDPPGNYVGENPFDDQGAK